MGDSYALGGYKPRETGNNKRADLSRYSSALLFVEVKPNVWTLERGKENGARMSEGTMQATRYRVRCSHGFH